MTRRPADSAETTDTLPPAPRMLRLETGPRVTLCERIGRGGCAETWRAHVEGCMDDVVVKLPQDDGMRAQRLTGEMTVLRGRELPGVPRLLASGNENGTPFLLLEYVQGIETTTLGVQPLPRAALLWLLRCLTETIAGLHDDGILHSDIKPENILLGRIRNRGEGIRPWLIDFGLARDTHTEHTRLTLQGQTLGTHGFLDPQTIGSASERTASSDCFSLGATAYHWYAGERLCSPEQWWHIIQRRLHLERGDITEERFCAEVDTFMETRIAALAPARRDANIDALLRDLLRCDRPGRPRLTMRELQRKLDAMGAHSKPLRHDGCCTEETLCALLQSMRQPAITRRTAIGVLLGITATGIGTLLRGRDATAPSSTPQQPQWTLTPVGTRLRVMHGTTDITLAPGDAEVLHGNDGELWIATVPGRDVCTVLEAGEPGLSTGLPLRAYPCYVLMLESRRRLLLSLPRACIVRDADAPAHFVQRSNLLQDGRAAAFLRDWETIDPFRHLPQTPETTRLIRRANTYIRQRLATRDDAR